MAALFEPRVEPFGPKNMQRWGTAPPVAASDCVGLLFNKGDVIWNNSPDPDEAIGWMCVTSSTSIGNPGTWSAIGSIGLAASNALFGSSARRVAHAQYSFAVDGGGAPGLITPASNATIPANAIITNVIINSTTAVLAAGGAATVAIGTSAGSSASSLLAATNKTSFSANALIEGVPRPDDSTTWVKMSAAGVVTFTSATNALTAGIVDVFVEYILAPA